MRLTSTAPLGLFLCALLAGCPGTPPPTPLTDAGPRDSGPDVGPIDAPGLDAPSDLDAPGGFDAPELDAPGDLDAPGGFDAPELDAPDDAPKDGGPDAGGGPPTDAAGIECADSRQCRTGFACNAGVCVDRRVHCGPIGDCPFGFFCDSRGAEPYVCARLLRPCTTSAECATGTCSDLDGDGDAECVAPGACDARSDCAGATTCQSLPVEVFSECGSYGACASAADCGSGRLCVDLWGDGVRECVDPGGCASTAACPGTGVCATPPGGGPPACLERPIP